MSRFDRGSLSAAGLLGVMLVLGVVSGIALERWVLRPERQPSMAHEMRMPRERFDPANVRTRFSDQLAATLALTADQRRAVDSVLRLQQDRTRAVMRETQPRLRDVVRETEAAMQSVLTPDQWRRWQELRQERMDRRPRRPMGGSPDIRNRPGEP
jgi:hypothetical protein